MCGVRVTRCPRCLAEDISADAHPSRRLVDGAAVPFLVCRNCFRAAELEFRIASDRVGLPYEQRPIRESLRLLVDFYTARRAESPDDPRIAIALDDVERRLAIAPVEPT